MQKISAPAAWDKFTGSTSVVVGVIDSGIDYNHPDLNANMWRNPGEIANNGIDDDGNGYIDDVYGWDFSNNDNDPMDDNSHGTHCAGTIAGVGNNGVGVAGVSWRAKLAALKFLSASGSGSTSAAIQAVQYANMMGFPITSNSWGGGGYSQALKDAIALGGLFVAAAGNSGTNNDSSPHYPSSYDCDNILAVAATDSSDALASFSCYGKTSVDIAAPGVGIWSCIPGNSYGSKSGTSMATPHVAGAAVLLKGYNNTLSAKDLKLSLLSGADKLSNLDDKVAIGGRLNVNKSLLLSPVNIALNKTATASSTANSYEVPSKAVDGDTYGSSAKWCSLGQGTDQWLKLDLGANYNISRWVVRHAGYEIPEYITVDFKLQKSTDGTTWTDVDVITNNTENVTDKSVPTFNARYVRLYITKPCDPARGSNARIYEFELYSAPSNLALNKTATASSTANSLEAPSKAVDGSTYGIRSKWCSLGQGTPQWLMVDLGASYDISRWVVRHAGNEYPEYITRDFTLQKSSDGTTWTDVSVITDNTENITDISLPTFNARYVRLYITTPCDPARGSNARIYEFEVHSTSKNLAMSKTASASSTANTSETPAKAVDANTYGLSAKWCSLSQGTPQWLTIDLGASYDISRWVVRHAGSETAGYITKDFKLQKSSDGTTWSDVDYVLDNTKNVSDISVRTFNARYVRLYITEACEPVHGGHARIYEFEIYK
ncbi:MAG: S8 family serine peptidase [Clostridia bacterium]|nr:S8 family serine peptidase [Clostridia bacterium]